MRLPKVFVELEVGGFFRLGLAGNAQQILGFGDDEEMGVLVEDLDSGRQIRFGSGKAVGADCDGISDGKRMIELRDGSVVDRHGLELEPGADLLFLLLRPGLEHLLQQGTGVGDREGLGHDGSLEEKKTDGNVWGLVVRRWGGSFWGCVFFSSETLWPSMAARLCGT